MSADHLFLSLARNNGPGRRECVGVHFNSNRINIDVHDAGRNTLYHDKTAARYYGKLLSFSDLGEGEPELILHSDIVSVRYVVNLGSEAGEIKVKRLAE